MRSLLPLLLFAFPALAADKGLSELTGKYTVREFHREGKAVPDEVRKSITAVSIEDEMLTITIGGQKREAKLKVDTSKKPPQIDLFPQNEPFEKTRPFEGIYELNGTTLTITYSEDGDRPRDFTTQARTTTKLVLEKK